LCTRNRPARQGSRRPATFNLDLLLPGDITTAAVSVKAEWINMGETDEIKALLAEIRDTQREYLAEYREVTRRSLELQQQAVKRQEQLGRLYRRVVVAGALLILCLLISAAALIGRILLR
jgi:CHASE3 domain sensor protein